MKKTYFIFILFFIFQFNTFSRVKSLYQQVTVTPENIEQTLNSLEYGLGYSIIFEDDFDFSKLNEEYFKYKLILQIHDLFVNDCDLKFTGPFEYLYIDGNLDKQTFLEIKAILEDSDGKYICVDISSALTSAFENSTLQNNLLPKNCFADSKNLYWIYFGDFMQNDITEGVCKNSPNLQCVFMQNMNNFAKESFNSVNKNASAYMNEKLVSLSSLIPLTEYKTKCPDDWDYSLFVDELEFLENQDSQNTLSQTLWETSSIQKPVYPDYSEVYWLIDGEDILYEVGVKSWWER